MKGFCSAGRVHMYVLIVMIFFLTLVPSLDILRISSPAATGEVQAAPANISAGFADLAEKLSPTVVYISTTKTIKAAGRSAPGRGMSPFFGGDDFFNRFFGDIPQRDYKQRGIGSGFIISADGYIVTNNHVIQNADKIKVKLHNGKEYDAEVKGKDPNTDIALIKINPRDPLTAAEFGDSNKLRVGDWVFAIGNPFGLSQTVTAGIVSAKGRVIGSGPYDDFIQTDASINQGNSGGPLFNLEGKVVGINTAIVAQGQGIGFAVPISMARDILAELKDKGKVVRGWLGISVQDITDEIAESLKLKDVKGALIGHVFENEPAEAAGLKSGDIVTEINGKPIQDTHDLLRTVATLPVGKKVNVKILRDGTKKNFTVAVGERKDRVELSGQEKITEYFGMTVQNISPEIAKHLGISQKAGIIITQIKDGSQADDANLKQQDIILQVNRRKISSVRDFTNEILKIRTGNPILLQIKRGDRIFFVTMRKEQ